MNMWEMNCCIVKHETFSYLAPRTFVRAATTSVLGTCLVFLLGFLLGLGQIMHVNTGQLFGGGTQSMEVVEEPIDKNERIRTTAGRLPQTQEMIFYREDIGDMCQDKLLSSTEK